MAMMDRLSALLYLPRRMEPPDIPYILEVFIYKVNGSYQRMFEPSGSIMDSCDENPPLGEILSTAHRCCVSPFF